MAGNFQAGIKAGATSISVTVLLRKTADNTEKTGVAAAGVTSAYYWRQGGTPTALTALSDLAAITTAYTAGGWKEADSTHSPGAYRLDVDNAAFATGADWVEICVVVPSCYAFHERYALTTNVPQSGDSFPSVNTGVAPGATGGLVISTQLVTMAQVATAVWQDTTSSDFTVSGSIGQSLFTGLAPGTHGGFFISGANTGPMSVSGGVQYNNASGDGWQCNSTGGNGNGATFSGNGTGHGLQCASGGGANSYGAYFISNSTTGVGLYAKAVLGTSTGVIFAGTLNNDFNCHLTGNNQGTNWASAIATGIWQDAVPGDFTVSGSAGFTLLAQSKAPRNVATHQQFPMTLTGGGAATGKTVSVTCSIDNAPYAAVTGGSPTPGVASEIGNGDYYIALSAADRNGKKVMYQANAAGCVTTQWEMDADG